MEVKVMRKLTLFSFLLLTIATVAFAQLGAIRGRVTDAQTGEALPGANVFLSSEACVNANTIANNPMICINFIAGAPYFSFKFNS